MTIWEWAQSVVEVIFRLTILGLITFAGWMLFDRAPVIEPISVSFEGDPWRPVYPGDKVVVLWTAKLLRPDCDGEIYQLWVDGQGHIVDTLPPDPVPARYSSDIDNDRTRTVPTILKPGPRQAIFAPRAKRWCNVLQHYLWPMYDKLPEVKFILAEPTWP